MTRRIGVSTRLSADNLCELGVQQPGASMNNEKINKWVSRLDFSMLCVWLVLGLALAVISYVQYGVDFRGYYAATRVLLDGGNPYDYGQVSRVLLEVTGTSGNNPFYYPPWFAWIFIPLVALPFQIARVIWMAVNFGPWNIALVRLNTALNWSLKGWRLYSLYAFATFSFAWITWRYEQAGILVFAILVETILSMQAGKWARSGIWLALLLIKPNVTLLIVASLTLWMIRNGQWRAALVAILVLAGLFVISTGITPDWYKPIFEDGFGAGLTSVLNGPDQVVAYRINSTFPDWLATMGVTRDIRYVVYGVFLVAGLIWFAGNVWKSNSLLWAVSVSTLASFALTPYTLQYDYPPLVIPLFWSLSVSISTTGGKRIAILLAGFVFSVIFWQQNISWAYWMVIGLAGLCFWGYYQETRSE